MTRRIILDTNVLSEPMRPAPDRNVMTWLSSLTPEQLRITAVSLGELAYGWARLPSGRRKETCGRTLNAITRNFHDRIYGFGTQSAMHYGQIKVRRMAMGRPADELDAQIAAIAKAHDCIVATRNIKDFEGTGVALINPWEPIDN